MLKKKVSEAEFNKLYEALNEEAQLNQNYIVLIITSCLIASFGLISNSAAVIIGAMIIAPLMLPLRSLAFGALEGDVYLFRKSLISVVTGSILAIFLSWVLGSIIALPEFGSEMLSRTQPNLVDLGIAITAGSISGFAKIRPKINDAVAGTAIAVALMPPICVVGLSLSQGIWQFSWGAFLLYITNLLGITLACMLVFIIAGYAKINHALGWIFLLNTILIVPLGISFVQLVKQSQLQVTLKENLVNRTITIGQEVQLIKTEVNWTKNPPEANLTILANKPITPKQVGLVEEFIMKKMGQKFIIIIHVNQIQKVRAIN